MSRPALRLTGSAFAVDRDLTVVIPTLNEAGNIRLLIERLDAVLPAGAWQAMVVDDDSLDGTAGVLAQLARERDHVRYIVRRGRRGLSSACLEGMDATRSPYLAVIDADLQHDEGLLPGMLARLRDERLDLVVASRYAAGGSLGPLSRPRERLSRLGVGLSRLVGKIGLSDPMSGYFVLRRSLLDAVRPHLSGRGTKILLDIVASAPQPPRVVEVPLRFRRRHSGTSKLDGTVAFECAMLLLNKLGQRLRRGADPVANRTAPRAHLLRPPARRKSPR